MTFDTFLKQAWNDHANEPSQVALRLPEGSLLINKSEQIPLMAGLMTHVLGEHLGQWDEGVKHLENLTQLPCFEKGSESEQAVKRSVAALELAAGKRDSVDEFSISDQIRVLAVATSALSEQGDAGRAQALFRQALERAQFGISTDDPANRSMAVTGNNLACALEEKTARTPEDTELMILAAQAARKFWEVAGGWLEVERAEYRLARTYLQSGELDRAHEHAMACLDIAQKNNAPALELFFTYEALALVEAAKGNSAVSKAMEQVRANFEKLSDDDKSWCKATLQSLSEKNVGVSQ